MNSTDFSSLKLASALLDNLATLDYTEMTPIQAQSLPHILNNADVIAQAKTGSGKTVAFGLGVLQRLDIKLFKVQTLVLCPTRELADQVAKEIRQLARGVQNIKVLNLCGGAPFGPQIGSLEHGAHVVVGTPGRVEEHLKKGNLQLANLNCFVLDEADRMLDMGFQESLNTIVEHMPAQRQTLLFSATFPEQIHAIAQRVMRDPVSVKVESLPDDNTIEQVFYRVGNDVSRMDALRLLLMKYKPESAVIFCNTKRETQEVADELRSCEFGALAIHGDLDQKDRDQALIRFANKSASILVATDVAARGLDIKSLDAVFNYQLSRELEVHTHRVGRTGRAGRKGLACTLYTENEAYKLGKLEEYLQQNIIGSDLPSLDLLDNPVLKPSMTTLQIDGGKKQKLRAGDILGALTGVDGIDGAQVGKIQIHDSRAFVAVDRMVAKKALKKISEGKLKGRSFKIRVLAI